MDLIYRLKQFYRSIRPQIDKEELSKLEVYLSLEQRQVFRSLSAADQAHSLQVALTCLEMAQQISETDSAPTINIPLLIQAALLHDMGKRRSKLHVLHRTCFVVLAKAAPALLADRLTKLEDIKFLHQMTGWSSSLYVLANHARLGAVEAKQRGWHPQLVYLIENHHHSAQANLPEAAILHQADNAC